MGMPHDVEWRSAEDALAYDVLLLKSVFTRLRRQSADEGILELDLFSKQQVIDELEVHEDQKLLRHRPNLRKLHTRLSSLNNIQESISFDTFRVTRVRDKTLSFDMTSALLKDLCRSQLEAESERRRLIRYKPMWCTRDAKLADNHPAATYNVRPSPSNFGLTSSCLGVLQTATYTHESREAGAGASGQVDSRQGGGRGAAVCTGLDANFVSAQSPSRAPELPDYGDRSN
ncbi:hypothetical protein DYB28_006283 [Aphanomyces astaci]|uniref:Uncharacterized protein n=1 Tax=Aphanomyces astaci TaxID=112090 RepID=A0A9X8DNF1_APHAT|nr:hypothetical protein DYB28_006283 [Aphanomyces astaci]